MTKITERNESSSLLTVDKALIEQVLEALTEFTGSMTVGQRYTNAGQMAIDSLPALRAALKEGNEVGFAKAEPVVEPVAVRYDFDGYGWRYIDNGSGSDWLERGMNCKDHELMYTSPPPAKPMAESCVVVQPPEDLKKFFHQIIHGDFLAENPEDLSMALNARSSFYALFTTQTLPAELAIEPMRKHVEDFAAKGGWTKDSGEGAFEFVQRISYAQGVEDGRNRPAQKKQR